MARPLRLEFPGALYHITARGNARSDIFQDDEDRVRFLDLLGKEVLQQRWCCAAYCLMDNHYHLLLETSEPNLGRGMRRLNGAYTQSFNRRHGRVGHLLQGRYKAILVDKDSYFLELCRYVVLNPVRAGMSADPTEYPWSSYPATIGEGSPVLWLDTTKILESFGGDAHEATSRYRQFVMDGLDRPSPWHHLRNQVYLGGDEFLQTLQKRMEGNPPNFANVPKNQRWPLRPDADAVLAKVAGQYGITQETALDRANGAAFKATVYLLRRVANLPLAQVAEMGQVHPSRISRIQAEIERQGKADADLNELIKYYWPASS